MEYDIFREKIVLKYPAYGHALWQPNPGGNNPAVEIGDVGFIREGHFHRLFNVLPPKAGGPDRGSVPPHHKPFKIGNSESPPTHGSTLQSNHFCSNGVSKSYEGLTNVPDEYSFSCSTGQGAILSLPVSAQREDIVAKDKFGKYMLKHLEEWFTFAREHVGIVRREDIVLVTGRDLAKSWANIVFQEGDGDVTFEVRVTGNSQIEWKFTLRGAGGVAHAVGPSGNLKDLPQNQCIFIRGFRATRIAKIFPMLRAAAGPVQVPSDDDPDADMQLISIPGDTRYQDPFYTLLKYIAIQAPNCDLALIHDDDLRLCIDGASLDSLQPDTFTTFLRTFAPKVWQVEWDCSPTLHSASTAAAAVKVAMFVNRGVKHVDSEHGRLRPVAPVGTDRPPTPYKVSTLEPVETPVVTENHSPMSPTSSSSRTWWPRTSNSRFSGSSSKKFDTIATAIGLKPKKTRIPIEEPASPVLPHTGDIESPPRTSRPVVKPASVAVGWVDPRALEPEHFLEAYPQSVSSTDLDSFAAAAKYGPPTVSDSLRFSASSEVSTLKSRVRKDAPRAHNRTSFASSSSRSHQRSDVTPDSSLVSPSLLSPVPSDRHLSRLTAECERMSMRDNSLSPSPVSQPLWEDDLSCIAASPSSVTLKRHHRNGPTLPRRRSRSRGFNATSHLKTDPVVSDQKVSPVSLHDAPSPHAVIRQPSSGKLQSLRPRTVPPASELPPALGGVQQHDPSLLPAFVERTPQSATSSSLSFASSSSSRLEVPEAEGRRRDIRQLKVAKKSSKSRPTSPSTDATRDTHGPTSKPSSSRREFIPTRSLKNAISIQNLPKRAMGNSTPQSLLSAEVLQPVKRQRSSHRRRIPIPPLPASLKQTSSSDSASRRDSPPVPEECKASTQSSQTRKSLLSSPVLSPTSVRKRLYSGTSLRQSMSSQTPEPDDDTPLISSLPSVTPMTRPHTAIPTHESSVSNEPDMSSFRDDETPNLNAFVRESPITQTASKHSVRTTHEQSTSARTLFPPFATRPFYPLGTASSKFLPPGRRRTRGNSLQGKVDDVTSGRSPTGVPSLKQIAQSLDTFRELEPPPSPRQCSRPSTSSGASDDVLLFTTSDHSGVVAPLSPPPMRRSAARRTLKPPSVTPTLRPAISRKPSFLDMRDEDREPPPPEDSLLDVGKTSLNTARSNTEEDLVVS